MKKVFSGIFFTLVLIIPFLTVFAANIQIQIDGVAVASDVAPEMKNNRTMVPLRVISGNLGATVKWSDSVVTLVKNDMEIHLDLNKGLAIKNGKSISLDAKPYIKNNRTMVPIRFIAESFGSEVNYENGIVTINTNSFIIDNRVVKGLLKENQNVIGSTVYQLKATTYIKDIYQTYIENKGKETDAPHYSKYDFSIPGTYYKTMKHQFVDENNQVVQQFEVYWLYDQFPAELLEGYPEFLLYDVTNNRWYVFNENAVQAIEQIMQKAQNNGLVELVSTKL